MPNILDPQFRYTPAARTDLKATFRRIKRELREKAEAQAAAELEAMKNVKQIKKGAKA